MFGSRLFIYGFLLLIASNIVLYAWILLFHSRVPFDDYLYTTSAHHYRNDPRDSGGSFDFFNALGQYDAQWYLKIAEKGYPPRPANTDMQDKRTIDGLTYAFFPLYPLVLSIFNQFFRSIELSAFILANIFMVINFISLYFVITKIYSEKLAFKASLLLFLFPFGIFYRSYFSEGLFLLFLIWFSYFFLKRQWGRTLFFLSFLFVTRPTGLFLFPLVLFYLMKDIRERHIRWIKASLILILSFVPFFVWILYNYIQTGSPFYWWMIQSAWFVSPYPFYPLVHNLSLLANYLSLPFHNFHYSKVDIIVVVYTLFILLYSRKFMKKKWWFISFSLWFFPLVTKDTISFARFQIISFPLFIYIAHILRWKWFVLMSVVFYALLLFTSLYFVNWWWVG